MDVSSAVGGEDAEVRRTSEVDTGYFCGGRRMKRRESRVEVARDAKLEMEMMETEDARDEIIDRVSPS